MWGAGCGVWETKREPAATIDDSMLIANSPAVQFSISERLLRENVLWSRGGLAFKAHRLVYHSVLGSSVIKKKKIANIPARRAITQTRNQPANFLLEKTTTDKPSCTRPSFIL